MYWHYQDCILILKRGQDMKKNSCNQNNCWGGKREFAGRKKTCRKKVSFNRRINEDVLNILKECKKE